MSQLPALLRTPLGRRQLKNGMLTWTRPILWRAARWHRSQRVPKTRFVAIVGSYGKTTTTRAVHVALGRSLRRRSAGNAGIALCKAILGTRPRDRHQVIEVGINGPGQMETNARMLRPDVTIVTSIGSEHNRSLPTLDMTRTEKAKMVRALPPSGTAILNGDDPNVLWMGDLTRARVITFGLGQSNDVRGTNVRLDWPHGTRFRLQIDGNTRELFIRLIGPHMVYPILAALAAGQSEGLSVDEMIPALESLSPTPGRMQPVELPSGAMILRDDYKGAEETFDAALDVMSRLQSRRRIVVLGDVEEPAGPVGPIYRRIGSRVAEVAELAIFIGNDSARKYAVAAKRNGLSHQQVIFAGNSVLRAVQILQPHLRSGDVVLVKGRGSQQLERLVLALRGAAVQCDISYCRAQWSCQRCEMLKPGWNGLTVLT